MKLHRIEVLNLNSLYGEHVVDLEALLHGTSLFLIHGPTGSGKSTLMDAVSLALFGVTPRLDASWGEASADPRAIMSRGRGECSASVVFSKVEGGHRRTYRARWTCWTARRKPGANLQKAVRSLERRDDGKWVTLASSSKRDDYKDAFKEALEGFGVQDFNRSMLLAQGQFDAFLGAPNDQRAAILERLTDTSIYKELGLRAARMRGRHAQRLKALRTLAGAAGGLGEAALLALEQEHAVRGERRAAAQTARDQAAEHLRWFEEEVARREEVRQAREQLAAAKAEAEEARPALEGLAPRSLSGGERFLVSLALALGLSDFRSVKMPIETLLLDEGFGTLDGETLSVALDALAQLQADGRQVGIISHVAGLPEKIGARVEILALGGGRSTLRVAEGGAGIADRIPSPPA